MKPLLLFLIFILLTSNAAAVGVTPPRIILEDVPKGFTVEKSVFLSGIGEGNKVSISLSGEGAEWITPSTGTEFISQGDQEVSFILEVPQKAPVGEYAVSAQIIVGGSNDQSRGPNSATVSSGILVNIEFSVSGEELRNYRIKNIRIPNSEIGMPLFVIMDIDNQGNVIEKPEKVDLIIKDKTKELVTTTSSTQITAVDPYTTAQSVATFRLDLEPEFYFADITVHNKGDIEVVENFPFDVLQEGALKANGELLSLEVSENVEKIAKIDAVFKNTGEIGLDTQVKGEIYRKETLIDIIDFESTYVGNSQTKTFTYYYTLPDSGKYKVKAYAQYLGETTNTLEAEFEAEKSGSFPTVVLVSLALLTFVVLTNLIYIRKRRRKK